MASKRAKRRRACKGKKAYADEAAAGRASLVLFKRTGEYVQKYRCKFCHQWHVGHWRQGVRV